jgi:hypothetical protein
MVNTTSMPKDALLFWRQWHRKIYEFGTLFFGIASSHHDINVLNFSPVFNRLMEGTALKVSYEINGNAYDKPYYLVDNIYPNWDTLTLVKTIRHT